MTPDEVARFILSDLPPDQLQVLAQMLAATVDHGIAIVLGERSELRWIEAAMTREDVVRAAYEVLTTNLGGSVSAEAMAALVTSIRRVANEHVQ